MLAVKRGPPTFTPRMTERRMSKSYINFYTGGNASMSGRRGGYIDATHDEEESRHDIGPVKRRSPRGWRPFRYS